MTFKEFIWKELISGSGRKRYKNINSKWGGFELEQTRYNTSGNGDKFMYNVMYDIIQPPLCSCGNEMKFISIGRGYNNKTCSLGTKCPDRWKKYTMLIKTTYDIDWFRHYFDCVDGHKDEFNKVVVFMNNEKIRISKQRYLLSWINNYINMGISNWSDKMKRTLDAFKSGELDKKDSTSEKSIKIRYGSDYLYILDDKKKKIIKGSSYEGCLEKCNGDEKKATDMYNLLKLKKSMSLESFIYRHGEEVGRKKYDDYWKNTTFAISKDRFKKKYGDNWECYYDKRIQLHRDANLKNLIYDPLIHDSYDEFKIKKTERYIKAGNSKKKENVINKLLSEGYTESEIEEYITNRWDNSSLGVLIKKYGDIEGRKKYKDRCSRAGCGEENLIRLYGEKEGKRKRKEISKKCSNTLENFVRVYGDEEGKNRYDIYCKRRYEHLKKFYKWSKESIVFWDKLIYYLKSNGIDVGYVKYKNDEMSIRDGSKSYFVDMYLADLGVMFEYNGIAFHPNPQWTQEKLNEWNSIYNDITAYEKIKRDQDKYIFLKQKCNKLFVYYSDDNKEMFFNDVLKYFKGGVINVE